MNHPLSCLSRWHSSFPPSRIFSLLLIFGAFILLNHSICAGPVPSSSTTTARSFEGTTTAGANLTTLNTATLTLSAQTDPSKLETISVVKKSGAPTVEEGSEDAELEVLPETLTLAAQKNAMETTGNTPSKSQSTESTIVSKATDSSTTLSTASTTSTVSTTKAVTAAKVVAEAKVPQIPAPGGAAAPASAEKAPVGRLERPLPLSLDEEKQGIDVDGEEDGEIAQGDLDNGMDNGSSLGKTGRDGKPPILHVNTKINGLPVSDGGKKTADTEEEGHGALVYVTFFLVGGGLLLLFWKRRQRILAYLIEGRRSESRRRTTGGASYRKLKTNSDEE